MRILATNPGWKLATFVIFDINGAEPPAGQTGQQKGG